MFDVGWLEPLLDRLGRNSTHVVSPVIANIHDDDFSLRFPWRAHSIYRFSVGGFNWHLQVSGHFQVLPIRADVVFGSNKLVHDFLWIYEFLLLRLCYSYVNGYSKVFVILLWMVILKSWLVFCECYPQEFSIHLPTLNTSSKLFVLFFWCYTSMNIICIYICSY